MGSFSVISLTLLAATFVIAAPASNTIAARGVTQQVNCDDYIVAFCCPNGNIDGSTVSDCTTGVWMGGEFWQDLTCENTGPGGSNTGICCSQAMVTETTYPNAIGSGTSCVPAA